MALALDALDLDADEIARRFAWARRRAQPAWLWPDVDREAWRQATARIEAAIRPILAGGRAPEPLGGEARAVGLAGYVSGMGPLLGLWVESGLLSATAPVAELLSLQLHHNRIRMERLAREARKAIALLAGAGFAPIVLKGMHTAFEYFPDPGARPCSDIDLFVAGKRLGEAERALAEAGYTPGAWDVSGVGRPWTAPLAPSRLRSLTFVHADDPWSLDLHGTLDRTFSPWAVARLELLADETGFAPWSVDPRARALAQPLLTLQLAAHASTELSGLTLLRLVELIEVIRRDAGSGALSWEAAAAAARRIDAQGFVYPALKLAEQLLPGTVPADFLRECEVKAPAAVRRVLRGQSPASAHRVDRWSLREQYMWCPTWQSRVGQTLRFLTPPSDRRSPAALLAFYGWRARRGLRAAVRW